MAGLLSSLWNAVTGGFDAVLSWLVTLIGVLLTFLVQLVGSAATVMLSWFPDADAADHSQVQSLWAAFLDANQYVPLDIAAGLTATWAGIYAAVSLYKLWKALPLT